MGRKTYDIETLVEAVNRRNKLSTSSPETRKGWNSLLEEVLHNSNKYQGYGFYAIDEVPKGHKPGIVRDAPVGSSQSEQYPDETRRYYYYSKNK